MRRMSDKALEDTVGETSVGLRRRFYLFAFSTSILAIGLILLTNRNLNPYISTVYPILIVCAAICFVLTTIKAISLNFVEKISTFVVMTSVICEFIYGLFFTPVGFKLEQELNIGWFWQALLVIQMIHLAFDTRRAMQIGLSLYAIITFLGLWKFIPQAIIDHNNQNFLFFLRYLAFASTSFALTQVLASSKELLALERLRSSIDPLTGAANRRQILHVLRSNSVQPLKVAVILFDLDHFKTINDRYGHDVGDHVLRETVRLVKGLILAIEPRATIGRWGGEEFLIVVPGSSLEEAAEFSDHIRKRMQVHPYKVVDRVTASFGVAYLKPDERVSSLVKRADEALYQAKTFGRNRIELSRSAPHDTADLLTTDVNVTIAG
jgi:diguanylate cyclase (GGDEF)-like protein